jgi:hypothetical protein
MLLLISCASRLPFGLTAQDVVKCKAVCQHRMQICGKNCINNCSQCSYDSNQKTLQRYARYVHEQCVKGKKVIRRLKSYQDPLQCRKTTCNCAADYHLCNQSCSGSIHKQLLAPPVCR